MSDVSLTDVRIWINGYQMPWLECEVPGCEWASGIEFAGTQDSATVTVGAVTAAAEQHLDSHRETT